MDQKVKVQFQLTVDSALKKDDIPGLVGDIPQMGGWEVPMPMKPHPSKPGIWVKALMLPVHTEIVYRYLYFVKGNTSKTMFEDGSKRFIDTGATKLTAKDHWSNVDPSKAAPSYRNSKRSQDRRQSVLVDFALDANGHPVEKKKGKVMKEKELPPEEPEPKTTEKENQAKKASSSSSQSASEHEVVPVEKKQKPATSSSSEEDPPTKKSSSAEEEAAVEPEEKPKGKKGKNEKSASKKKGKEEEVPVEPSAEKKPKKDSSGKTKSSKGKDDDTKKSSPKSAKKGKTDGQEEAAPRKKGSGKAKGEAEEEPTPRKKGSSKKGKDAKASSEKASKSKKKTETAEGDEDEEGNPVAAFKEGAVIYTGFFWKKGLNRRNWTRREAKLHHSDIEYWKKKKLKGVIPLEDAQVKRFQHRNRRWTFAIATATREYYIDAETEDEMHEWLKWIGYCIEYCSVKPILTVAVELKNKNQVMIDIYEGDDPYQKAKQFCEQYDLNANIIEPLRNRIQRSLDQLQEL